jgi:hypothetical protein
MSGSESSVGDPATASGPRADGNEAGLSGRWRRWQGMLRYHGIWAPGVRWFRDRSLTTKSLAVLGCLLVPLSLLGVDVVRTQWKEWQDNEAARLRLKHVQQARALTDAVGMLNRTYVTVGMGGDAGALTLAVQRVEATSAALQHALKDASQQNRRLASAVQVLLLRQREVSAQGAHFASPTPQQLRAMAVAFRRYGEAMQLMRRELLSDWRLQDVEGTTLQTLREGLLDVLPNFADRVPALVAEALLFIEEGAPMSRMRELSAGVGAARGDLARAHLLLDAWEPFGTIGRDQVREVFERDEALLVLLERALDRSIDTPSLALDAGAAAPTPPVLIGALRDVLRTSAGLERATQAAVHDHLLRQHEQQLQRIRWTAAGLLLGMLVWAYVMGSVYRVTAGGLRALCQQLDELGRGNLAIRPQGWGADEVGQALNSLRRAAEQMSHLFESFSMGVQAVSHATRDVAEGNAGLAGRTHDIQRSIHEVSGRSQTFTGAMQRCGTQVRRRWCMVCAAMRSAAARRWWR